MDKFFPNKSLTLSVLAVALCGCAAQQPFNGDVRALSPEEIRLQAAETKIADLTRRINGIEASRLGPQVSDDLRSLHGEIEELQHTQQKYAEQLQAIDQRLQRLESGAAPAAALTPGAEPGTESPAATPAPVAVAPAPVPAATSAPVAPPVATAPAGAPAAQEEALYQATFAQLKAGKYDDAIRGFRQMLDQYPQGSYADNAWYWLGETYYFKRDLPSSLQSFNSLLQRFPASPKVPDALVKVGKIYVETKKTAQAKEAFQRVIRDFPKSNAASVARSELSQL